MGCRLGFIAKAVGLDSGRFGIRAVGQWVKDSLALVPETDCLQDSDVLLLFVFGLTTLAGESQGHNTE